jgi:hypothetical protein
MATRVYSLALNYNTAGQFCSNILHLQFDDSGFATTQQAAQALITAWLLANQANLISILPTDCTLLSVRSRLVNGSGGFEGFTLVTSSNVGTRTGATSVSGLAPVIVLYPVANGDQRGRVFLPGVAEPDCVDGIFTVSYKTAVAAAEGIFENGITLVGGGNPPASPCIYNRATRLGTLIANVQLSPMLGQIRRRQLPV